MSEGQPNRWLTESDKTKYIGAESMAKFKNKMAKLKAQMDTAKADMEMEQDRRATKAAAIDTARAGKQKADQQAQDQEASSQEQKEPLSNKLTDNQDYNSPSANNMPMELPEVPNAPPFLMDHTRTSQVGPRQVGPGWTVPMRTTTNQTRMKPNAITAGDQAQLVQQRAFRQRQLNAQKQRDTVSTVLDIATLTGDFGAAAAAAKAWGAGDTNKFYEALAASGPTLPEKIAQARIDASKSTYNLNRQKLAKVALEIDETKVDIANAKLKGIQGLADLNETRAKIRKLDMEAKGLSGMSASESIGIPSAGTDKLTDNELINQTSKVFKDPETLNWFQAWREEKPVEIKPEKMAVFDSLRTAHFDRGSALVVVPTEDGKTVESRLVSLNGVFSDLTEWATAKVNNQEPPEGVSERLVATGMFGDGIGEVVKEGEFQSVDWFLPDSSANTVTQDMALRRWDVIQKGGADLGATSGNILKELDAAIMEMMSQMRKE